MSRIQYVMESKMGNTCIIVNNYKLSEYRLSGRNKVYRCTNRNCHTYITVDASLKRILKMNENPHEHEPMTERVMAKEVIRCVAIRRALADQRTRPSHIIQNELDLNPELAAKLTTGDFSLIRKSVYSARKKFNDDNLLRSSGQGSSTEQARTGRAAIQFQQQSSVHNYEFESSPLASDVSLHSDPSTFTSYS